MDYYLLQDIKTLINVEPVPNLHPIELQYRLHSYGFVFWLNDIRCTLTKKEKKALTEFRIVHFQPKQFGKSAPSKVGELMKIAKKMSQNYPAYQTWVQQSIGTNGAYIHNHSQWKKYQVLTLPMKDLKIEKRIKRLLVKSGYRSLHEMLLVNTYHQWRKIIISNRDFNRFFAFGNRHDFIDLLTR